MFNYFKNKYVFRTEDDIFQLVIITRSFLDGFQALHYITDDDVRLRDMDYYNKQHPLIPLPEFLQTYGYSKKDFKKPIGRIKRILSVINEVNEKNKPKIIEKRIPDIA